MLGLRQFEIALDYSWIYNHIQKRKSMFHIMPSRWGGTRLIYILWSHWLHKRFPHRIPLIPTEEISVKLGLQRIRKSRKFNQIRDEIKPKWYRIHFKKQLHERYLFSVFLDWKRKLLLELDRASMTLLSDSSKHKIREMSTKCLTSKHTGEHMQLNGPTSYQIPKQRSVRKHEPQHTSCSRKMSFMMQVCTRLWWTASLFFNTYMQCLRAVGTYSNGMYRSIGLTSVLCCIDFALKLRRFCHGLCR